jgi:hypothetical protein
MYLTLSYVYLDYNDEANSLISDLAEHLSMDIRPLFSEYQWPRVESRIRESIEEFTLRRLQPQEGSSAQYLDSSGNQTSSPAQETRVQRSSLSTRMPQSALHDPTRVQGRVFMPSQHLPGFSLGNEMVHEQQPNRVQHSGRGNETIDSAYFTTSNPTNASPHTGTGFPEGEPVAIGDFGNPEETLLSPGQGFLSDNLFFEYFTDPSGAQEHPDLIDLDLGGVGSTQRRNQHRQNRY